MNATEIVVLLFLVRLIIPFGMLLLVGEWLHRYDANYWLKS